MFFRTKKVRILLYGDVRAWTKECIDGWNSRLSEVFVFFAAFRLTRHGVVETKMLREFKDFILERHLALSKESPGCKFPIKELPTLADHFLKEKELRNAA